MSAVREYVLSCLGPSDDDPDPEGVATEVCAHCDFPIVRRRVPTGRQFFPPFWEEAWVHTDSGRTACWTPNACPSGRFTTTEGTPR